MANMTVVRNQAYTRGSASIRERHNERKNECYSNADIQLERSPLNFHFKHCAGTYTEEFDRLLSNGVISTRGLKPTAKVIDEMVFDVNTLYFEENGGYDFAKRFYEEAYRLAVKEAGNERYILSAVMHADEVNIGASAALEKDVYHYHLHVVYIPVVEKEVKWTKRCKDPALVGKIKENIQQVSHSKKWPRNTMFDENGEIIRNREGNAILVNSYSLLQDRFYEHMKSAGFKDFERGTYGSTAAHQSTAEFKIHKDMERLEKLEQAIEYAETEFMDMDITMQERQEKINALNKKLAIREAGAADLDYLDDVGKKDFMGRIILTPKELNKVRSLAQEGAEARGKICDLENALARSKRETNYARGQWNIWKQNYDELLIKTKPYLEAIKFFPQKVMEFLERSMQEHKAAHQARKAPHKERRRDYER